MEGKGRQKTNIIADAGIIKINAKVTANQAASVERDDWFHFPPMQLDKENKTTHQSVGY